MDTLLEHRTHAVDEGGQCVTICGARALIQRLLIRLCVKKGSFAPDPELGSELYKLPDCPQAQRDRMALHLAQQALLPELRARVMDACCRLDEDTLIIGVTVEANGISYPLEVLAQ